jgi:RNA polymerase sigma-70 factor (ECF subfamily)
MICALGVTYERHRERLRVLASRHITQDADDIVQDAFIRAIQARARFRHRAALSTWLHRIVVNECISRYRKLRWRERIDTLRRHHGHRSTRCVSAETLDIRAALRALPRTEHRVLIMHDVMGHTHDEIGAVLRIPVGTSKWRLCSARRRLRASVGVRAI